MKTALPRHVGSPALTHRVLPTLEIEDLMPSYELLLAWRSDTINPAVAAFKEMAETMASRARQAPATGATSDLP